MRTLWRHLMYEFRFVARYFRTLIFGLLSSKKYKDLQSFCLFIGYPRSGHSLIASLLDAHPNMIIGMEWCVLSYINQKYRKNQIFYSIWKNSVYYKNKKNNVWTGYSYKVPNSYQGNFEKLKVIGDKKGGRSSLIIKEQPNILLRLHKTVRLKIKIIHVIRNPFDIITTMTTRSQQRRKLPMPPSSIDLLPFINGFFERADSVLNLKKQNDYEIFDLYNEQFIENPKKELTKLIEFLGLNTDDEYLNNCCSIVYDEPHLSRKKVDWSIELIEFVEQKLLDYPFLAHYKFKE